MTRSPLMTRWARVCMGTPLPTLAMLCAWAASPKRVLILDPCGRDVAPFSAAISGFRSTLARELGEAVDFFEVRLDLARCDGTDGEVPLAAFLEDRVRSHSVDLVVPVGGAGVQFAARQRKRPFPDMHHEGGLLVPRRSPPSVHLASIRGAIQSNPCDRV